MTEEDMMPSGKVAVFSSRDERYLPPLSSLGTGLINTTGKYELVRLSEAGHGNTLETLDIKLGRVDEVASIVGLRDGSWEMVVRKSYCPTL